MISLNFAPNVELRTLIDLVSQRLGMNILYDQQQARQPITIQAPEPVAESTLVDVLRSALRMRGLALVPDEAEGWWRVVQARTLAEIADLEAGEGVVTRLYGLRHRSADRVEPLIRPFLSAGANAMATADGGSLIVTDFIENQGRIQRLINDADTPGAPVASRFIDVQHVVAADLASQVQRLLAAEARVADRGAEPPIVVEPDARTNRLLVSGEPGAVERVVALAADLDVPLGLRTKAYKARYVDPERIDRLAQDSLGATERDRLYRSSIDDDSGLLIVTTSEEIHRRVESLIAALDVEQSVAESPVQSYKVLNASAQDLLAVIAELIGESVDGVAPTLGEATDTIPTGIETANPTRVTPRLRGVSLYDGAAIDQAAQRLSSVVSSGESRVAVDANTNSIIVIGPPKAQRLYAELIRLLDKRRPQVLIEATVVAVDRSGGQSLGVEILGSPEFSIGGEDFSAVLFSAFGLSEFNPATNTLELNPGLGFNGAVVDEGNAQLIIRALKTTGRGRVVASPRVLVNDNATGTIESVAEAPFTSVNASDTVATTSFAGFVEAGTTIEVTPQIAEGDHLRLDFSVALNSFTGAGGDGIPPPRQTSAVASEVTVPDGHTVIVGGVRSSDQTEARQGIPVLGDIPIIEHLFGTTDTADSESFLYVFIRPVILRDDQFEDLKFFSRRDASAAELSPDNPDSAPIVMR
ncbi:MAG: secretin N-terminal domain-containing protein [Planctomycetota bacterium]